MFYAKQSTPDQNSCWVRGQLYWRVLFLIQRVVQQLKNVMWLQIPVNKCALFMCVLNSSYCLQELASNLVLNTRRCIQCTQLQHRELPSYVQIGPRPNQWGQGLHGACTVRRSSAGDYWGLIFWSSILNKWYCGKFRWYSCSKNKFPTHGCKRTSARKVQYTYPWMQDLLQDE